MAVNSSFRTLQAANIEGVNAPRNYITNNFENGSTVGFSLFNTTLTSGLPTGSISAGASSLALSTTTTNPLAESTSLQVTAAGAVTAGQGIISDAFTIDRADHGQILNTSFYYEAISGASNANFSGILGSQSFAVYVYDVTAGVWVQPSGFLGMNTGVGPGKLSSCVFQGSTVTNQQYQIAIICLQATAGAITLNFDRFVNGPVLAPVGPIVTDFISYTPVIGATTTPGTPGSGYTQTAIWRRVGDSMEIDYTFSQTNAGSTGSGTYLFPLPTGYTIDTTKVTLSTNGNGAGGTVVGNASEGNTASANTSTNNPGFIVPYNTTNLAFYHQNASTTTVALGSGGGNFGNNPFYASFNAKVPIVGWSSNVQMSNDTDTRVIAASYTTSGTSTPGSNVQINFDTKVTDNSAAVTTGASWKFTAPVSGTYFVSFQGETSAGNGSTINLFKNGSSFQQLASSGTSYFGAGSCLVPLNAGDYIDLRTTSGSISLVSQCVVSINRLSGPSVIAATESVNARYHSATGTPSSGGALATYTTKDFDSHSGYASGIYTIPISGKYHINALLTLTAASGTADVGIQILQNGSVVSNSEIVAAGAANNNGVTISDIIQCNAGDAIKIFAVSNGTTPSIITSTTRNVFSIARVGN